jgi:hypothetical protein
VINHIAHEVGNTTYYACPGCGACPCPEHNRDHTQDCIHRVPDEWLNEVCGRSGLPGSFMICSACMMPPCRNLT